MDELKIGETDLSAIVTKVNELVKLYNKYSEAEIKRLQAENKLLMFQAKFKYNEIFKLPEEH